MIVIVGGIMLGVYCTLSPALVQPFMRKVTGSNDLAYGHTTSFGVIMGDVYKRQTYESGNAFLLFALIATEDAHSRRWAQAGEVLIKLCG